MNPDTLQSLGVLAIALGFVLIGLGGFSTYHASQQIQHAADLRAAEQKGDFNTQMLTLMLKNQELLQKAQTEAATAPAADPAPSPAYFRPPSPPPPTFAQQPPPPVEPPAAAPEAPPVESAAPPPRELEPVGEAPNLRLDPLEPSRAPEWTEPDSLEPDLPSRYLSIRQRHVIADTLRAHGRHTVTIESSYGDPVSREFAGELETAFTEADWLVRGIDEHRGLPLASGVTVSAASFPPQQETRAVYEALLSAGIPVTQQLDPKQRNSETVILVGTPL